MHETEPTIAERKARIKALAAARYQFNRDARKAKARERYYADPEPKRAYAKAYRERNPEKVRRWAQARYARGKEYQRGIFLRNKYGLAPEEYDAMIASQGGGCAVCHAPESKKGRCGKPIHLSVDHDHESGVVRGLLCNDCNRAIGLLGDNSERVRAALDYLVRNNDARN